MLLFLLVKQTVAQMARIWLQCRRLGFNSCVGKSLWRREWLPTPVFLPGEFHGQRSLAGYSPQGRKGRHNWVTNSFPFFTITQPPMAAVATRGHHQHSWKAWLVALPSQIEPATSFTSFKSTVYELWMKNATNRQAYGGDEIGTTKFITGRLGKTRI